MKIVTSVTTFNDSVGLRMSASYSEVDDVTGQIVSDNKRVDRIVTDQNAISASNTLKQYAQNLIDALDS